MSRGFSELFCYFYSRKMNKKFMKLFSLSFMKVNIYIMCIFKNILPCNMLYSENQLKIYV